jgi:hypothetical protein
MRRGREEQVLKTKFGIIFLLLKKIIKKKSWKSSEQILPTWQYFSFEKMKK